MTQKSQIRASTFENVLHVSTPFQPAVRAQNNLEQEFPSAIHKINLIELLTVETKQCATCKSTVKEQETSYLLWQEMCFCDTMCLYWYQRQNLINICPNCFKEISPECTGMFVFQFDDILQFCSLPCFQEYQAKRKSCLYCMREIQKANVRVIKHNPLYCSEECVIKHVMSEGKGQFLQNIDSNCSICKSNLHPITIYYHSKSCITSICSLLCLQSYTSSIDTTPLSCVSCKVYFSSTISHIEKVHRGHTRIFCSEKCRRHTIFSNLKIYPCGHCNIKRFDIDLIQRCSKIEPLVYMCSVQCYLKRYFAGSVSHQYFTFDISKILSSEQALSSKDILKPTENSEFECVAVAAVKSISKEYSQKLVNKGTNTSSECFPRQSNVATMCSVQKADKSSSFKPKTDSQSCQTDTLTPKKVLVPIPIPMYVPAPMHMYSVPLPSPVPFPLPIPVPIFIPVPKNNFQKILNDTQKSAFQTQNNVFDSIAATVSKDAKTELKTGLSSTEGAVNVMFNENYMPNGVAENNDKNFTAKMFEKSCLDMHIGIQALLQWVKMTKPVVLQDPNIDILLLSSSQLANCMSLFVREVRRPNGKTYAPDTIFYLCLSIQKYLFKNGNTTNIFFDETFIDFIENLDSQLRTFPLLFSDTIYIITRVEEEHLWESGQLGSSSPYILLNTILYHNMKYFHLMSTGENLSLLIFTIVKIIKNKNEDGQPQIALRLYKDRELNHFYEMPQNVEIPERCPVKLFELYCSKLPSVGIENFGQFYFKPETTASAVNPVWFSGKSLDKRNLEIMMNRLVVVKELNIQIYESLEE